MQIVSLVLNGQPYTFNAHATSSNPAFSAQKLLVIHSIDIGLLVTPFLVLVGQENIIWSGKASSFSGIRSGTVRENIRQDMLNPELTIFLNDCICWE